ncbi:exopolygalacturonase-like [Telopea speciosissima]|uniref:exopolygalacturonase-like n=1 Tax=Telopea speciosissima TaxID=54955 RepID=UPI001CC53C97|nr:exopolygalacturonase-like [Telopea speciosissima]
MAAVVLFSCLVALLSCVTEGGAPLGTAVAAVAGRPAVMARRPVAVAGRPAVVAGRQAANRDITVFNVLTYGAKPDGRTDNTQAFMKTWVAACHWKGKARFLVPLGTFLVGPVIFAGPCVGPPPIIVQILGTVKAVVDISEYESPEWFLFERIDGIILTGGGTFDGQGDQVWKYNDCKQNSGCQLMPANIKFNHVNNGRIRGIHSLNSKAFHFMINFCQNLGIRRINIIAPDNSPNTDGIHISDSNSIGISKSMIGTGDDCISIGQGSTNVTINGVSCGPGHGISVGSLGKYDDEKEVNGITVKNCTLSNTDNGVRIKTWPGSPPGRASGFIFDDIIMNNVQNPIIIDQQYCSGSSCKNKPPSRVQVSNVHFMNIRGTSATKVAVSINCSRQFPCQNVQLSNINLKFQGKIPNDFTALSQCSNVKLGFAGVQVPAPCR